jgi:hypothetical protein
MSRKKAQRFPQYLTLFMQVIASHLPFASSVLRLTLLILSSALLQLYGSWIKINCNKIQFGPPGRKIYHSGDSV